MNAPIGRFTLRDDGIVVIVEDNPELVRTSEVVEAAIGVYDELTEGVPRPMLWDTRVWTRNDVAGWPTFLEAMIPAMAVFAVMAAMLMGIPAYVVTAREEGIFRSYHINGVPSASILAVPSLTNSFHLMIVVLLIT